MRKVDPGALAKIIASQWQDICLKYNSYQIRTLSAIRQCRTPQLGGSRYLCDRCGEQHFVYHSCRNRHCPQCQNTQIQQWIAKQESKLIDTRYYHVVFTIPHHLNNLFLNYPRQMYSSLMRSAWQTIDCFGWNHKYLGAQIGCTMVLHTWGSNLSYHPHVHCIVPGGGVDLNGKWRTVKNKGKFLFPVKALSKVFRGKMMNSINDFIHHNGMELNSELLNKLYQKPWVVYAKPTMNGTQSVIMYLARYASKVAITHHRILSYDDKHVRFSYTDYRHKNQKKILILDTREFIRRFIMHILPKGFCKIRHFGILSGPWKNRVFSENTAIPKSTYEMWKDMGFDMLKCRSCNKGKLIFQNEIHPSRGPPENLKPKTMIHNI